MTLNLKRPDRKVCSDYSQTNNVILNAGSDNNESLRENIDNALDSNDTTFEYSKLIDDVLSTEGKYIDLFYTIKGMSKSERKKFDATFSQYSREDKEVVGVFLRLARLEQSNRKREINLRGYETRKKSPNQQEYNSTKQNYLRDLKKIEDLKGKIIFLNGRYYLSEEHIQSLGKNWSCAKDADLIESLGKSIENAFPDNNVDTLRQIVFDHTKQEEDENYNKKSDTTVCLERVVSFLKSIGILENTLEYTAEQYDILKSNLKTIVPDLIVTITQKKHVPRCKIVSESLGIRVGSNSGSEISNEERAFRRFCKTVYEYYRILNSQETVIHENITEDIKTKGTTEVEIEKESLTSSTNSVKPREIINYTEIIKGKKVNKCIIPDAREEQLFVDYINTDLYKALRLPQRNETITGSIVYVCNEYVVLNTGCKKDAVLPQEMVTPEENQTLRDRFKEGDILQAKVIKTDDGEGNILISVDI